MATLRKSHTATPNLRRKKKEISKGENNRAYVKNGKCVCGKKEKFLKKKKKKHT